jgi:hypothetical protein
MSPALQAGFEGCPPSGRTEGTTFAYDARWFKVGADVDEAVPITWEDEPRL